MLLKKRFDLEAQAPGIIRELLSGFRRRIRNKTCATHLPDSSWRERLERLIVSIIRHFSIIGIGLKLLGLFSDISVCTQRFMTFGGNLRRAFAAAIIVLDGARIF